MLEWWAELFALPVTDMFHASAVTWHAPLGDYQGWFGGWRDDVHHLSFPPGTTPIETTVATEIPLCVLGDRESWHDVVPAQWVIVGPSVHCCADHSTLLPARTEGPDVERIVATDEKLRRLRGSVPPSDWEEAGFDDDDRVTFSVQKSGIVVAAVNLTRWCDGYTDVGVVVRPIIVATITVPLSRRRLAVRAG